MTFGSLFSGIGGGDLGLERVGMVCKWQVEHDRRKVVILERNWPNVERIARIQDCVQDGLCAVDLVCGGDSCPSRSRQGFPRGWTAGFIERRRRAMLGEAMTVNVVQWIGERILEAETFSKGEPKCNC